LLDEERPGAEAWIKTGMANPTREQLATAVANSLKDRGSRACISNLKQLQTACEQARLEGIKNPKMTDLIGRDRYIAKMPRCPSGGVYSLPTDGSGVPTCSCCTSDKFPHKLEGHATNTACQENKARPVDHKKVQHNRLQRQHNQAVCISNLKQLQAACEQARLSGIKHPTMKDLIGEDKYIKNMPVCPCGGTYSLPEDDDSEATCSHNDPQCPHKVTLSAD